MNIEVGKRYHTSVATWEVLLITDLGMAKCEREDGRIVWLPVSYLQERAIREEEW